HAEPGLVIDDQDSLHQVSMDAGSEKKQRMSGKQKMEKYKKSSVIRKAVLGFVGVGLAAASGGCLAVAAAGGAVGWQAGKIISEERVPRDRAVDAALETFKAKQ